MKDETRKRPKLTQVVCPSCGYKMPIYYTEHAEIFGLRVACKGRGCNVRFDIIVKDGVQIK